MSVFEKIYEVVKTIPKGKVATYGQVAFLAGNPRWARVVGYALHNNPSPKTIPCHRVVNREGKVAEAFVFGGGDGSTACSAAEWLWFCSPSSPFTVPHCRVMPPSSPTLYLGRRH